jgi:phosphoglycolate phosphatase-like HAD superfamily hydrolase
MPIGQRSKGLFLDFDGTLADSIAVMRDSYERFLAVHQAAGSEAERCPQQSTCLRASTSAQRL